MRRDALDETALRERDPQPSAGRRTRRPGASARPFRVAVIEQCTYDGTIYDAEMILEAHRPSLRLHPVRRGLGRLHEVPPALCRPLRHGARRTSARTRRASSRRNRPTSSSRASRRPRRSTSRTATSSGQRRRVEHRRFNESFMQHASTSPFYPLFASLDVGAQMMKGRSGEVLWDDTIRLGIELRKKMRAIAPRVRGEGDAIRRGAGSSSPSCPTASRSPTSPRGRRAQCRLGDVSTDQLAADPRYWQLAPDARLARLRRAGAGLRHDRSRTS